MKIIGLTGPSGAGKSAAAGIFARRGIAVIDADRVYRELISRPPDSEPSPCLDELRGCFGGAIISADGGLDRAVLRGLVFGGGAEKERNLARLNAITHKHVLAASRIQLDALRTSGAIAAVVDAPQLFESGFYRECGIVISVLADRRIRLDRVTRRDGIGYEDALSRFDAQHNDEYFIENSDYIIQNNGDLPDLTRQIDEILRREVYF